METTTKERESQLEPGVRLERRVPGGLTIVFYAFAAAAAWTWLHFTHPGRSAELFRFANPLRDAAIGLGAGAALAGLSQFMLRKLSWLRAMESEFGWILGHQARWTIPLLAVVSAVAEEYLFRGALQTKTNLWVAAVVFAAFHFPFNPNVRLWPVLAAPVGLLFGFMTLWSGNLLAPVLAHAVVNLVNLWVITGRFHDWDETRVAAYIEGR